MSLIPRLGRSPGEGNGNPLAGKILWTEGCGWATVRGVIKRWVCLSRWYSSQDHEESHPKLGHKKRHCFTHTLTEDGCKNEEKNSFTFGYFY